jgi:hypothetical protein
MKIPSLKISTVSKPITVTVEIKFSKQNLKLDEMEVNFDLKNKKIELLY